MPNEDAITLATQAVEEERALAAIQEEFALKSPEFAAFLKTQQEAQKKIDDMWAAVKDTLVKANYTDIIENDNFRISISKVLSIKVPDPNELPEEYTETVKVAKMDKIKKHFELYEELPVGAVDASFYRLNKKVK